MPDNMIRFGIYCALLVIAVASVNSCSAQENINLSLIGMKACKS